MICQKQKWQKLTLNLTYQEFLVLLETNSLDYQSLVANIHFSSKWTRNNAKNVDHHMNCNVLEILKCIYQSKQKKNSKHYLMLFNNNNVLKHQFLSDY